MFCRGFVLMHFLVYLVFFLCFFSVFSKFLILYVGFDVVAKNMQADCFAFVTAQEYFLSDCMNCDQCILNNQGLTFFFQSYHVDWFVSSVLVRKQRKSAVRVPFISFFSSLRSGSPFLECFDGMSFVGFDLVSGDSSFKIIGQVK
ncbi:hypothetical protein IPH25_05005 [bacterium]|nr:MAG: hypothetical protein IPG37_02010 [bacterium]QQR61797.1 MAG: hypothetical protein IPH25_05005 [bacterium]QQR62623.1 MAG: hypothetical protein IPH67_04375 [bacterium]